MYTEQSTNLRLFHLATMSVTRMPEFLTPVFYLIMCMTSMPNIVLKQFTRYHPFPLLGKVSLYLI